MTDLAAIVARFGHLVAGSGGTIELVRVDGDEIIVRYDAGTDDCDACVLTTEDLAEFILEATQRSEPSVKRVTFV
jgi:Fe-S cluster biogenesis protein NfuA